MAAYERLEPCVGKLTCKVLMGLGFSNELWLPDHPTKVSRGVYLIKKLTFNLTLSDRTNLFFYK